MRKILPVLAVVLAVVAIAAMLIVNRIASARSAQGPGDDTPLTKYTIAAPSIAGVGTLDDGQAERLFQQGIGDYKAKNYLRATNSFYQATLRDPEAAAAHFYLGICYLMTNDSGAGVREFKMVTRLEDKKYAELAHLYIAKASLRNLDNTTAKEELDRVIGMHGPHEAEAKAMKDDLPDDF